MSDIDRVMAKASKSICKHKIAALGLDRHGRVVCCKFNRPRFGRKGGGVHAELEVIKDLRVRKVVICRINGTGKILPLHPCPTCARVLGKLGIEIESLLDLRLKP